MDSVFFIHLYLMCPVFLSVIIYLDLRGFWPRLWMFLRRESHSIMEFIFDQNTAVTTSDKSTGEKPIFLAFTLKNETNVTKILED